MFDVGVVATEGRGRESVRLIGEGYGEDNKKKRGEKSGWRGGLLQRPKQRYV